MAGRSRLPVAVRRASRRPSSAPRSSPAQSNAPLRSPSRGWLSRPGASGSRRWPTIFWTQRPEDLAGHWQTVRRALVGSRSGLPTRQEGSKEPIGTRCKRASKEPQGAWRPSARPCQAADGRGRLTTAHGDHGLHGSHRRPGSTDGMDRQCHFCEMIPPLRSGVLKRMVDDPLQRLCHAGVRPLSGEKETLTRAGRRFQSLAAGNDGRASLSAP